jgi:hypothetical protein
MALGQFRPWPSKERRRAVYDTLKTDADLVFAAPASHG